MKSETLIYGYELLVILDENEKISFANLEKISKIKDKELRELLKYLQEKSYLNWKNPLFINEHWISDDKIILAHKGMEVVLGKKDYFEKEEKTSQTIHNQTNVHGDKNQVAQTTGDNSPITQIQDNSKINILRKLIEDDKELDEPKKEKLFGILKKFNLLKESGENAYELIKQIGSIATKYIPLFLSLLN